MPTRASFALGILSVTKKYSRKALEECAKRDLISKQPTYTYIKNTIGSVAEELGADRYNTDKGKQQDEGAYVMDNRL